MKESQTVLRWFSAGALVLGLSVGAMQAQARVLSEEELEAEQVDQDSEDEQQTAPGIGEDPQSTAPVRQKTGPGIGADPNAPQTVELNEQPRPLTAAESAAFEQALKKSVVYQVVMKGVFQNIRELGNVAKPVVRIQNRTIHRTGKVVDKNKTVYTVTVDQFFIATKKENKLAQDFQLGVTFNEIGLEETQAGKKLEFKLGSAVSLFEVFRFKH
jgi:hypothetical protein